jgi:hypothetical protein
MKVRLLQYLVVKNILIKVEILTVYGLSQNKLNWTIDLLTYTDSVLMPIHVDPLMWFLPRSESCDTVVQVMDEQLKWTLLFKYITYISVKINSLENIGVTQYISYPITHTTA